VRKVFGVAEKDESIIDNTGVEDLHRQTCGSGPTKKDLEIEGQEFPIHKPGIYHGLTDLESRS
jgi:hypothetical protein